MAASAAQIPPSAAEIAAYRGLHAAAARGDAGEIERLVRAGTMRATAAPARRFTSPSSWASRTPLLPCCALVPIPTRPSPCTDLMSFGCLGSISFLSYLAARSAHRSSVHRHASRCHGSHPSDVAGTRPGSAQGSAAPHGHSDADRHPGPLLVQQRKSLVLALALALELGGPPSWSAVQSSPTCSST